MTASPVPDGGRLSPPSPIHPSHDVSTFRSGVDGLDDWLRDHALRSEGRSARTYVVCEQSRVIGYYVLASGSVVRSEMPRGINQGPDPMPVIILGRLAVDRSARGRGIGADLMRDAMRRAVLAASAIGARALLVHAFDEAIGFYATYGFKPSPIDARTMFLPMETIVKALET